MKRSESQFPLENNRLLFFLANMWKEGWLDEYSNEHFLIKAIENRLSNYLGKQQLHLDNSLIYPFINEQNFSLNFLINFSMKMNGLCQLFEKKQIKRFVLDQLSAGKENYKEEQFFRALSEISVISYFCNVRLWKDRIYEPQTNGKKKSRGAIYFKQ